MTYEEHENVVTSAANALYSAIHSAKIDNLRISVGMETLYTMGEGITYICDSLDISLVDPMKNVSEGSIAKYRDAIMSVLEDLTDALTAAAEIIIHLILSGLSMEGLALRMCFARNLSSTPANGSR